ncbi:hypothetical protein AVEN_100687-1 [Araneus ventricosus]|uniref:F-box domain-containing protein n=1 Tax=Araneus ventricosus TaxID=182803 RepID=A0A4Y2CSP2_ARAVE|nr:hypothetical protein AVEN_100687-1 [Araneus ventricosus]
MSLVSRKWSEVFGPPPGCETFKFALTKSQLSMDTLPGIEFVHEYSRTFLHVEIEYIHGSEKQPFIKRFCRHFIVFLQILTRNSQLISVKFLNLSDCFEHMDTPTYAYICRIIIDFIGSQHRLRQVEFRNCFFRFHEGVELLRKLTENSRESLTHLVLLEFIRYEPMDKVISSFHDSLVISPSTAVQNLPLLVDLPSLITLDIDYSFIFENMVARHSTAIQTVKNCQTLVLSKIVLHYDNQIVPIEVCRGLTSTNWRFLKISFPDLQVELIIDISHASWREVEFLIVPNMPITGLKYHCYNSDMEIEIGVLLGHLLACKTNDHMVSLHFDWLLPIQDLVSTFPPFLQACRKLKRLELFVAYPANGIDLLMQSWLENQPESLEEVLIHISEIEEEDAYANSMILASELKLRGLNVEVDFW